MTKIVSRSSAGSFLVLNLRRCYVSSPLRLGPYQIHTNNGYHFFKCEKWMLLSRMIHSPHIPNQKTDFFSTASVGAKSGCDSIASNAPSCMHCTLTAIFCWLGSTLCVDYGYFANSKCVAFSIIWQSSCILVGLAVRATSELFRIKKGPSTTAMVSRIWAFLSEYSTSFCSCVMTSILFGPYIGIPIARTEHAEGTRSQSHPSILTPNINQHWLTHQASSSRKPVPIIRTLPFFFVFLTALTVRYCRVQYCTRLRHCASRAKVLTDRIAHKIALQVWHRTRLRAHHSPLL